jgi:hypothetical protein
MNRFPKPETNLFAARAMTGSIILFDHVHPLGAFHKKSPIQVYHYHCIINHYRCAAVPYHQCHHHHHRRRVCDHGID